MLRTRGDSNVGGRGVDAFQAHNVSDLLAQHFQTLTATVLHSGGPVICKHLLERTRNLVQGQVFQVRHATGQRDHLRAGSYGKQGSGLADF